MSRKAQRVLATCFRQHSKCKCWELPSHPLQGRPPFGPSLAPVRVEAAAHMTRALVQTQPRIPSPPGVCKDRGSLWLIQQVFIKGLRCAEAAVQEAP